MKTLTRTRTMLGTGVAAALICLGWIAIERRAVQCYLFPMSCVCGSWEVSNEHGGHDLATGLFARWHFTEHGEIIGSDGFCSGSLYDYEFVGRMIVIRSERPEVIEMDSLFAFDDESDDMSTTFIEERKEPIPRDHVLGRFRCSFEEGSFTMVSADGSSRIIWKRRDQTRPAIMMGR